MGREGLHAMRAERVHLHKVANEILADTTEGFRVVRIEPRRARVQIRLFHPGKKYSPYADLDCGLVDLRAIRKLIDAAIKDIEAAEKLAEGSE